MPFNLSYNSQNWSQDSNGNLWNEGRDSGFGWGWKLQGGALTPIYAGYFAIDHYVFTDATGAEYRLDVNTNGIWTSRETIYVEYDSNAGRLYFSGRHFLDLQLYFRRHGGRCRNDVSDGNGRYERDQVILSSR